MESLIELELPEQIVESTEGGGLRPAVPVHDEEGPGREVVLPALDDRHQVDGVGLHPGRLTGAPAGREDHPHHPGRALPALQPEVLGLEPGQQTLLRVLHLHLPDPQRVVLWPEDVHVGLSDVGEHHHRVDVLLPDQPPEVHRGVLLRVLGEDKLGQTVETRDPAGVDVVRSLLVLQERQDDPAPVHGQEVEALVLELVGRQSCRPEACLSGFVGGHLVPVPLEQLPGPATLLGGVVALQALDVPRQVGRPDVGLSTGDGLSYKKDKILFIL